MLIVFANVYPRYIRRERVISSGQWLISVNSEIITARINALDEEHLFIFVLKLHCKSRQV